MALKETPVCAFGAPIIDFRLLGIDERYYQLADCLGEKATLIMFICNHCPYVQAIQTRLIADVQRLKAHGVQSVAIMSNDSTDYPEDSFVNMQRIAREYQYPFPYLLDDTQATAKAYGAECTPDFFGYNHAGELQYRGRLDAFHAKDAPANAERELVDAMRMIADSGSGPSNQKPSIGCSIKWKR